jgi:cell division septum initiation protein DivIVA
VRIRDERLTMDSVTLNAIGGRFRVNGWYDTTDPARPGFDIDVAIADADIAQSFEALTTVRMLAPVARYAEGRFSTSLHLTGALTEQMTPVLSALTGRGALETTQLVLQSFPPMERLADALNSTRLHNPAFRAIATAIDIRDGRLHVRPFDVGIGPTTLTVGGSNGIDRSLDYNLVLALPQPSLESAVRQRVTDLLSRAGVSTGLDSMSIVRIAVRMAGTIDDPSIELNAGQGVQNALQSMEQAASEAVERTAEALRARADSASAAARRRAEAEAQRLIGEAQQRADVIRTEARELAETIRREAGERADSLVASASSPIARIAAERAAGVLRSQADDRANQITGEADERADGIVERARAQAATLLQTGGAPPPDTLSTDTITVDTLATQPPAVSPSISSERVTKR